jgi:hypothetical protein
MPDVPGTIPILDVHCQHKRKEVVHLCVSLMTYSVLYEICVLISQTWYVSVVNLNHCSYLLEGQADPQSKAEIHLRVTIE